MPEIRRDWIPLVIQTITLLAGGIIYANGQEHRVTVIEESVKTQQQLLQQMAETQRMIEEQLRISDKTLQHIVNLEEFFHGDLSSDEQESYNRAKNKAKSNRAQNK